MQDRAHVDVGRARPGRAVKIKKQKDDKLERRCEMDEIKMGMRVYISALDHGGTVIGRSLKSTRLVDKGDWLVLLPDSSCQYFKSHDLKPSEDAE